MLRFAWLVIASLTFHIVLYSSLTALPPAARQSSSTTDIELLTLLDEKIIEPKNPPEKKPLDKPVIENTTEKKSAEMKDPAYFMAEKNQRFEKQTKAAKLGAFQNQTSLQKSLNRSAATEKSNQSRNQDQSSGDTPEFAQAIQNQIGRLQEASIPYDLPSEIENGAATNLNADAHIYASFYSRVLNLFYVRWSERLNNLFERMPTDVYKKLAGKIWVTDVEIILSADGLYQKGFINRSSGFKAFDEAGLMAFKSARFFPNPPQSKVQEDGGQVRLRYRIAVHVR